MRWDDFEAFFEDEDEDLLDEDSDEDFDDDEGDEEDDDSVEVTVQLPKIKTRPVGAIIQTATMKEMDAIVEILKPTIADKSVSITAYTASDPKKPLLEEAGGDVVISDVVFLVEDDEIPPAKSQLTFETITKNGAEIKRPVMTWVHEGSLTDDIGLMFSLRKPR